MSVVGLEDSGPSGAPVPEQKVTAPQPPPVGVTETPALRALQASIAPVVLVVAPPGAGKSMTLASWVHGTPQLAQRVAWASLDARDDAATSLWATLLTALRRVPVLAADPGIAALSGAPAAAGVDEALIRRLGTLLAGHEPAITLVIDDVHVLESPEAVAILESLLELRPSGLRLVLSARYPPRIAFHRLRLGTGIEDIGSERFLLDRAGATALFAASGHDLPAEVVEALWRRTEGWVAGLRLAVAELDRGVDPHHLAASFGGTTPTVSELLVAEVLEQLPEDVRAFLVATGGARELTPSLAERLTGRGDAGALLEELHRRNALVQRLETARDAEPAYRYHDLLRDFLGAQLRRTDLPRWREIQGELAAWYGHQRQWRTSLEHAVASADQRRIRSVLREAGVGMILDGDGLLLERLLGHAPVDGGSDPIIGALLAAAALSRYDTVAADRILAAAQRSGPDAGQQVQDPWLDVLVATVDLYRARFDSEVAGAMLAAETAGVGASGDPDLDLLGLIQCGVVRLRLGHHDGARHDLERALHLAAVTERDVPRVMCLGNLAALDSIEARIPECDQHLAVALDIVRRRGWVGSQLAVQLHVLTAWFAVLRGDLSIARGELAHLPPVETFANPDMRVAGAAVSAITDHLAGTSARTTAGRLRAAWEHHAGVQTTPEIACLLLPWEVQLWLAADDPASAAAAGDRRATDLAGSGEQVLIEVLLARASGTAARHTRRRLAAVRDGEVALRYGFNRVWVWLLEAQLTAEAGARQASDGALLEAVRSAARDDLTGLVRAFGPAAVALLEANRGRFGPYEAFVTAVVSDTGRSAARRPDTQLTPAEQALLRELPTHRSVADIADLRGVSVNTVKTHLKSLYRKLDVGSRAAAVEQARALGYL